MHWFTRSVVVMTLAFGCLACQALQAQEGEPLLDQAVDKKLDAKTPRDLDKVADLCEEAIEKGLSDESLKTAQNLWASANFQHAQMLAKRIFRSPPDPRWKFLRQQALERLEQNLELKPDNSDAWLMVAKLQLLDGGDKDAAKEAVTKALENSGDDEGQKAETLILRSQTSDDEEQRWADINQALELEPGNTLGLRVRGQMYVADKKYDEAIADFAKLATERNSEPVELLLLARGLRGDGEEEAAMKAVTKAIEINQDMPSAYSMRAALYLAMEKDDEALADVTRAIELNPKDMEGLRTRARVFYQKKKYNEALKDVEKIIAFQEGDIDAMFLRSLIYAGMEDYDAAIEEMQFLVQQIPNEPMLQSTLASLYLAAKQHDKAIEIYDRLLKEDPENERALTGRGDAKLNSGEHAAAVKDYEAALALNEEDDHILNNLAWVLGTSTEDDVRDGKRAVELASKAAEITEYKQAHILSTLAAAYAESGDFENAVKWSEKSVELAEDGRQKEDLMEELNTLKAGKPIRENEAEEADKDDDPSDDSEAEADDETEVKDDDGL